MDNFAPIFHGLGFSCPTKRECRFPATLFSGLFMRSLPPHHLSFFSSIPNTKCPIKPFTHPNDLLVLPMTKAPDKWDVTDFLNEYRLNRTPDKLSHSWVEALRHVTQSPSPTQDEKKMATLSMLWLVSISHCFLKY